jgi:hypothetical protein
VTIPGTPVNSIQFNNPLGTFAGDALFTFDATAKAVDLGGIPSQFPVDFGTPKFVITNDTGAVALEGIFAPVNGPLSDCGAYRGTRSAQTATQDGDVLCSLRFDDFDIMYRISIARMQV